MTVHDSCDPITMLETQLAGAIGQNSSPQLFAAIRARIVQGRGPSLAVLGGMIRESGSSELSDPLHKFNRSTSKLLRYYNGKSGAQFSHRPGIFRFESMLRMRRMLMSHLDALKTQKSSDIALIARQLNELHDVVSTMGGVPVGFGLQRLFADMRIAAKELAETHIDGESDALIFLQNGIDNLQEVWPLGDPKPQLLSNNFVEEIFFKETCEPSVQKAVLLDIVLHSDQLLRDPVKVLGRALNKEWRSLDAYLVNQFSNRYGMRYMPDELRKEDSASLDEIGAINYDDSWKSYRIIWEMLRALGRQGENARPMLPKMVKRFVFLTSVLSSYAAILEQGASLYSGKGRMTDSLRDMPAFEELMVLTEVMQAIDPNIVAGKVVCELRDWLLNADMSPGDRGYALWRLQGVIPSDSIEDLAGNYSATGIAPYVPQTKVDPSNCSLSDYIRIRKTELEFRQLISTVRDLSSTPEASAQAIEQLGLMGGKAAAGLFKEIVLSAPPQLVPRDDVPVMIVPSPDFMGNAHYWEIVTPAAIGALHHLGVDIPRPIVSTTNFSYARTKTRYYSTGKEV